VRAAENLGFWCGRRDSNRHPLTLYLGVKDGGNDFAANPATVVTTDGRQIDGVPGGTGIIMGMRNQALSFLFDGMMWGVL
jgi:hypothetical protein